MSRLSRSIGALLLAVVVCAGASAGPAFGHTSAPPEPTTTEPTVPTTEPTTTQPTETEPSTTEPTEPTVEPTVPEEPSAPEAPADPAEGSVDLTISVTFDKPSFSADETIVARARVTNTGTVTARQVHLTSFGSVDRHNWSGFGFGVSIEPGQTVEGTLETSLNSPVDLLTLEVTAHSTYDPDADPADNTVTAGVPITYVRGGYQGTVYADRNGNTVKDAGEEFAGLSVAVSGGRPVGRYTAMTDSAGRFEFQGLPRGYYEITFDHRDWAFRGVVVEVDGVDDPDLVFLGARRITSVLTASAAFDRESYQVGDTAHLTLTLTNSGSIPVPGVTASCGGKGLSSGFDLGELALDGPGTTIPANAGRTFEVQSPVDRRAPGYVAVWCEFGAPPGTNGGVTVYETAQVHGAMVADIVGMVVRSPNPVTAQGCPSTPSTPVPNVKIYLKDQVTGAVIARATSNAEGRFELYAVPVGLYGPGVVGPWKTVSGAFAVPPGGFAACGHVVRVEPGPDQPDPDAPPPGGPPAPAPGAGPGQPSPDQLASTGVNVTWLALGGLLTLLAGVGLMSRTRRREIPAPSA